MVGWWMVMIEFILPPSLMSFLVGGLLKTETSGKGKEFQEGRYVVIMYLPYLRVHRYRILSSKYTQS